MLNREKEWKFIFPCFRIVNYLKAFYQNSQKSGRKSTYKCSHLQSILEIFFGTVLITRKSFRSSIHSRCITADSAVVHTVVEWGQTAGFSREINSFLEPISDKARHTFLAKMRKYIPYNFLDVESFLFLWSFSQSKIETVKWYHYWGCKGINHELSLCCVQI